jgi:hypothetical protein
MANGRDAILAVGPDRNVLVINGDQDTAATRTKCWLAPVVQDANGKTIMKVFPGPVEHGRSFPWDGQPIPSTFQDGPITFKGSMPRLSFGHSAYPSLADLDGDGKAVVITFDPGSHSILAFRNDSQAQGSRPAPDTIATIPGDATGVSVVSLGDDSKVLDFFAGTYWVRRFPNGTTQTKNMLPEDAATDFIQPTVVDLRGDGKADVIFGLSDGRLFVYQTGLAYHADRMQWPTEDGNFQHTGVWKPPPATR